MPTKGKVNKSAAIRELLSTMGLDASPTEVSKRLKSKGITVSPDAVSTIKLEMRKRAAASLNGSPAPSIGYAQRVVQWTSVWLIPHSARWASPHSSRPSSANRSNEPGGLTKNCAKCCRALERRKWTNHGSHG